MNDRPQHILLIEDNPGDARLIQEMLLEAENGQYTYEWVDRLAPGLERLAAGGIDIVLLDLSLPDSQGLNTCREVHNKAKDVVIIVFTGFDDVETGTQAVQVGAQDYLVKGKVDSNLLIRSMRYAVERHRMLKQLKEMSITDELTGLNNRRGLAMAGDELLKLARRLKKDIFVLFMDVDGMKWINDTFGHREGDRALKETADLLKEVFRDSDIFARIGGDEFVVIGISGFEAGVDVIKDRFAGHLGAFNARRQSPYELSISVGIVSYGPENELSVDVLLSQADKLMYEQKRSRRTVKNTPSG